MIWAFAIGGVVLGGAFWGLPGAISVGFLGWLTGIVVQSLRAKPPPVERVAFSSTPLGESRSAGRSSLEERFDALEQRLAALEAHVGLTPVAAPVEMPEPRPGSAFALTPAEAEILRAQIEVPPEEPPPEPARKEPAAVVGAPEQVDVSPARLEVTPAQAGAQSPPPPPRERIEPEMAPAGPSLVERLLEGNIVAKIGVVILFFGVAFLLKFAYDRGFFPPWMRLAAVAAAGLTMFLIGWKLRETSRTYALVLIGGAMGLAYLDVYFALKTFAIIGPVAGFALFAALGVATLGLAVRLDARAVAVLGLLGGFMAPVLASTGSGQHVILFSYYLLLNIVILAVSWFRSWRELNFIGFLFTFAIALFWGHANYRPELFATVEPFLIAYFFLYLAIPILFAHRQPPQLRGIVDATLVFGMPLSAAMMQAALTRGMGDRILAWSAALAALVYGVLAAFLWRRANMRLLAEAHLALAIVFGTVAPYFAFEGYPTFAFWTVEGAAIYWIGCRQRHVLARAFALLLQVGAAGYFWSVTGGTAVTHAIWNQQVIGCALICAAGLTTAWMMHRHAEAITAFERALEGWVIAWSMLWLLMAAVLAIRHVTDVKLERLGAVLVVATIALAACEYLGRIAGWARLRMAVAGFVPLMAVVALLWFEARAHPLQGRGAFAWPVALAVHFHLTHRQLRDGLTAWRALRYVGAWSVLGALATWEAAWRWSKGHDWWVVAIGTAGLLAAGLRYRLRERGVAGALPASPWVIAWALVWWFAGWHGVIEDHLFRFHWIAADLAMVAISIAVFELAGAALGWRALRATQVLLPAMMAVAVALIAVRGGHPFAHFQLLSWLAAFGVCGYALWRQERDRVALPPAAQHVYLFVVALLLLVWEAHWQVDRPGFGPAWQFAAVGAVLAIGMEVLSVGLRRGIWPFSAHAREFQATVLPLLLLVLAWTLVANLRSAGNAAPWPYLPVLNPLDLAQLALFAASYTAVRLVAKEPDAQKAWMVAFGAAAFLWLNAGLMRTVHHWAGVPFDLGSLLASVVAQASLSLLWTVTALALMFAAGKRRSRRLWMTGAALLGIVVVKLFVNDLGNTGTVARIVTFIGVGVFMLLIGYLSPVPPRRED